MWPEVVLKTKHPPSSEPKLLGAHKKQDKKEKAKSKIIIIGMIKITKVS